MIKYILTIAIAFLASTLNSPELTAAEAVVGISKRVYTAINEAQEFIDAESYPAALDTLDKTLKRKISGYEKAVILNMTGYVHYQLEDTAKALQAYKGILLQPRLPDSMIRNSLLTISQLYLIKDDYVQAEKFAIKLLNSRGDAPPPLGGHIVLAQALIGQERHKDALEPLLTAINTQRKAGKKVRENWLALLSSVYFSLENFSAMREVLYEMITINPREQYLMNLAAIHGQLGDTDKQLALIETLNEKRRLKTEPHLLNLANLFMAHDLPFKAASLLETEMAEGRIKSNKRNLQLQSQAWYLAGEYEKALPPLREAATALDDGELWLRMARLYFSLYDWPNAEKAAQTAAISEDLKKPGEALILQGMALTRQKKFNQAKKIFRRARQYEKSKKWAKQWLDFVVNEQERLAALQ